MKDLRNVQSEYGLKLRWINGGGDENGTWDYRYFLEKENGESVEITNQDAIKFIATMTLPTFRNNIKGYNAYVKLFDILGIEPKGSFKELIQSHGMSGYKLAKLTKLSQSLIAAWVTNDKRPLQMSLDNANKVAKALQISLDQLYEALSK